jgi:hypothetical protein
MRYVELPQQSCWTTTPDGETGTELSFRKVLWFVFQDKRITGALGATRTGDLHDALAECKAGAHVEVREDEHAILATVLDKVDTNILLPSLTNGTGYRAIVRAWLSAPTTKPDEARQAG